MSISRPSSREWRRILRLAGIGLLGTLAFVALTLGPPWFHAFVPPSAQLLALVGLMRAARSAYVALAMVLPAAIVVLAGAVLFARRRGARLAWLARSLALCMALALAMALAEGVAAARLAATRPPPPPEPEAHDPSLPNRFPDPPGDRTVDIVVLGESSALGVPYHDWLSVGEIVAWKLREAVPDRSFAVKMLARSAITFDRVHQSLESLDRRPDLVILYAGHNEFSMRYGWNYDAPHYADEMPPSRGVTLLDLVHEHSPVCRLIDETAGRFLMSTRPKTTSTRRLVDVPVYTAADYAERLREFRARLEVITAYCERMGALVVLVIPPGNDADFDPNRSFMPPETPRAAREAFAREFEAARKLEAADPAGAIAAYRRLLESQPRFAEAHYRLAKLHEAAGRRDEANRHYIAARDCDGLPVRCTSDFQDAYRELAANHLGTILIDGPAVLRGKSPRGVVGDDFFADAMHPSLIGYTEIARAILISLRARRVFGWGQASPAPESAVTPAECARHFGMDPDRWQHICDYAAEFYHFAAIVRFDPSARKAKEARFEEASRRIRSGTDPSETGAAGIGTRIISTAPLVATAGGTSHREPRKSSDASVTLHHRVELVGAQE
jgi:tetratricopeptide (TPR) repeat protein